MPLRSCNRACQAHTQAKAAADERGAEEAQAALEAVRRQVQEREERSRELAADEQQSAVRCHTAA